MAPPPGQDPRRGVGRRAERLAAWWLRLHGWSVLHQGLRVAGVQVDLIAARGGVHALVEVKVRRARWSGSVEDILSQRQLERLVRAKHAWAAQGGRQALVRLDLLEVRPGRFLPGFLRHEDIGRG